MSGEGTRKYACVAGASSSSAGAGRTVDITYCFVHVSTLHSVTFFGGCVPKGLWLKSAQEHADGLKLP